ncbi:hypothetical protein ZEAMMB73_Zm00001d024942, partial [Zea mays]
MPILESTLACTNDFALHVQEDPTNSDSDAKNSGRTKFPADEDAHSVGDCVKVPIQL